METVDEYDVVVVGCGTAGLSSAMAAAENGASVAVLEKAPKHARGGQSQYVATTRIPTKEVDVDLDFYHTEYTTGDFYRDIMKTSNGTADPDLTQALVNESVEAFEWLYNHTIKFEFTWETEPGSSISYGSGKAFYGDEITATLIECAEDLGADVIYEAGAYKLIQDDTTAIEAVEARVDGERVRYEVDAVVIACGGFEANTEKRTRYLGGPYEEMKVRGVRYNTGEAIDMALEIGADSAGQWSGAHMSPVDAHSPDVDGGDGTTVYGYPFGIILNHDGERFVDEGEDIRGHTYAKFGRRVFEQPYREAFVITDATTDDYYPGSVEPVTASTIEELVNRLGIENQEQAVRTFQEYNESCAQNESIDPTILDGKHTEGVSPPKSNWAKPLTDKPLCGYGVTGGLTFTYGGLAQSVDAEVLDTSGNPIPGLYAAGNATGGIFYNNYPGGTAQTKAYVFGKIAGERAAELVKSDLPAR